MPYSDHIMSSYVIFYPIRSCPVLSCPIIPHPIIPYPIIPYHIIPYHAMPTHVVSHHIIPSYRPAGARRQTTPKSSGICGGPSAGGGAPRRARSPAAG